MRGLDKWPRFHQHLCSSTSTPTNQLCIAKSFANMQTSIMSSKLGSTLKLGGNRINRPASSCTGPSSRVSAPIQAIFTRNKDKSGKVQPGCVINHQQFFWPAHAEAPDLALLQQQKGYDKSAKEVDPAIPAFTRRREVRDQHACLLRSLSKS